MKKCLTHATKTSSADGVFGFISLKQNMRYTKKCQTRIRLITLKLYATILLFKWAFIKIFFVGDTNALAISSTQSAATNV
jgi:hypothetical protein